VPRQNEIVVALTAWLVLAVAAQAAPVIAGAERVPEQAGAILYTELGCANCHGGASGSVPARSGPNLYDLPVRVDHGWLLEFLANPEHDRMPAMFDAVPEADRSQAIKDVAAWLGTLKGDLKLKAERHANAERGSALYHEIGCVACHAPTSDFKPEQPTSPIAVPLPDLKKKTSLPALADFLSNTSHYRPDSRMPQIPMDRQEAIDIAAHLLDYQSSDPRDAPRVKPWPQPEPKQLKRGRTLVESLNCAACHDLPGIELRPIQKIKGDGGGCIEGEKSVRYQLSKTQKEALIAFLPKAKRDAIDLLLDEVSIGSKHQSLSGLNCYACHERSGVGGPTVETDPFFIGDPALGDAGRIPPPLTLVGRKLKPEWLEMAVRGDPATRVRPYLKTRMPIYPRVYESLAHSAFLLNDVIRIDVKGADPVEIPPDIAKVDDLAAGRKLLGTHGGVNCITCHGWGGQPSLGIQGMDLSTLDQRLHPQWFREFLLDPSKYRTGTLMPPLWPDGKATVKDVLSGDTEKQIGAIWAFIRDGEGLPDGFPDRGSGQFELVPKDRPIIQRTFLEGVGTHAILVGFPGGVNIAYDAATAAPKLVWRGRFFDAYNTWFSRFAPFEKPLGKDVEAFPDGEDARFRGYEIDAGGNPIFLSRIGEQKVTEHFEVKDGKLIRTVTSKTAITTKHPRGVDVVEERNGDTTTFIYSWK